MADQQATATERRILKVPTTLKSLVEGLIFAAREPLTVRQLKAIYEEQSGHRDRRLEQEEIQAIIDTLNEEFKSADKPYRIIAVAGGYQFATLKEYAEWLGVLYKEQSRRKLSQSSLETLAIVAYKQPISKPEVESIRGVNCDYVMKTLLEKELVTIVGRAETVGRPLLYGTTREFLKHFGLNEITDLPRPREIEEILGESEFDTARRMLEAQAAAEQMKNEEDFKSRLPHIPKKKPELDDEVRILPKGRPQKLTVRPKEEVPATETAEAPSDRDAPLTEIQPPPNETVAEPEASAGNVLAERDVPVAEEASAEVSRVDDRTREPQSAAVEPPVLAGPAEIVGESHEEPRDQAPADALPLAIEEESSEVVPERPSELTSSPQEPEVSQPRKSAWAGWKEKIQTFIRKLFG
jgi:segregation and condensation protein B